MVLMNDGYTNGNQISRGCDLMNDAGE